MLFQEPFLEIGIQLLLVPRYERLSNKLKKFFIIGSSGGGGVQPPVKPTPPSNQCRVPETSCPSDWKLFDDYEILGDVFAPPCEGDRETMHWK